MDIEYKRRYLKYKKKYLELKQSGGSQNLEQFLNQYGIGTDEQNGGMDDSKDSEEPQASVKDKVIKEFELNKQTLLTAVNFAAAEAKIQMKDKIEEKIFIKTIFEDVNTAAANKNVDDALDSLENFSLAREMNKTVIEDVKNVVKSLPEEIKKALKNIVVKAIVIAVNNIADAKVNNDERLLTRGDEAIQALEAAKQEVLEALENEEATAEDAVAAGTEGGEEGKTQKTTEEKVISQSQPEETDLKVGQKLILEKLEEILGILNQMKS